MSEELNKIKKYIENEYGIPVEIILSCQKEKRLLMKDKKYDVTISVEHPDKKHYLYEKCELIIDCSFEANKKYGYELGYHGGGYSCEYNNDNIDRFLNHWFTKRTERQLTIFDFKQVK